MKNTMYTLGGFLVLGMLAGCAATSTPNLDKKFGEAVNAAKAQQIINPDAPRATDPVKGVDGVAAAAAMDLYKKSYESPPAPTNVFTIGIGSGGGATAK